MGYQCGGCDWTINEPTQTDLSTAAIRHYVETGHSVERYVSAVQAEIPQSDD